MLISRKQYSFSRQALFFENLTNFILSHLWKNKTHSSSQYAPLKILSSLRIAEIGGVKTFRILTFSLLVLLSSLSLAKDIQSKILSFNIPQQRVDTALIQFAEQVNLTLIVPLEEVEGKVANRLVGKYSVSEAIRLLLLGTGLEAEIGGKRQQLIILSNRYPGESINMKEEPRIVETVETVEAKKNVQKCMPRRTATAVSVAAAISMAGAQQVCAEEQDTAASQERSVVLEEVSVLGTRRSAPRSAMDAAVPVDVIKGDDINSQASTDMLDVLKAVIPSFNANREPISDAATLVRPVNLRGLPSDHTLVLVNGKRRHRGAVVGEFVSGLNAGAQGVDINPLFGAALKQVEVLRDGAAAQYGSDAIAGVMNFAYHDDPELSQVTLQFGSSYEGDGDTFEISGAFGTHWGDDGFATLAFQAKDAEPTSRGVQDGEGTNSGAAALAAAGFPVADPVVVWGQPEVKDDYKLIFNAATNVGDAEFYTFGSYATRDVDGSFFYRHPAGRAGVFVDGDGNALFADSTGAGCPTGALPTSSFAAAQAFIAAAPANCFAYNSIFPGGFTPRFGGTVKDYSLAAGFRGQFSNGMNYDFSVMTGENDIEYKIDQTVNASLGAASPTSFDLGAQTQSETVINADFSIPVNIGLASDLNVAFGAQYHDEEFEITAGQLESYVAGPFISQGFSAGSNGFQGFSAENTAGVFDRSSKSVYLDLEADVTDNLLLSVAARHEDFDDFGSTSNAKIAARLNLSDNFAIRSAVSTGFRAPTLGQSNLQRSSTIFSGGQLVENLTIGSTNPIAEFFGGGQLDPEEAQNFSLGFTASIGKLDLTVDYFDIDVEDRISLTSASISSADRATLVALDPAAATLSSVSFFVNDFDTNTSGLDIVANYPIEWSNSTTDVTLALNYTDTEVTNPGATIGSGRLRELQEAIPEVRATLSFNHQVGNFNGILRFNYYDEAYESLFNSGGLPVVTDSLILVDAEASWQLSDKYQLSIGAKNLFDEYPDEWTTQGFTGRDGGFLGAIYPLNHPAGLGGGSYYLRLKADF